MDRNSGGLDQDSDYLHLRKRKSPHILNLILTLVLSETVNFLGGETRNFCGRILLSNPPIVMDTSGVRVASEV